MNKRKVLFCIVLIFQFLAGFAMIAKYETILKQGQRFLFKTAPVDPYDAFRGRYVALSTEQETLHVDFNSKVKKFIHGQEIYALLDKDPSGFAVISDLLKDPPLNRDYLKVKFLWQWKDEKAGNQVRIAMPFKRYYMNEKLAPQAERLYREHSRVKARDASVAVRIYKGEAVIENLYISGRPIEEAVVSLSEQGQ